MKNSGVQVIKEAILLLRKIENNSKRGEPTLEEHLSYIATEME